MKRRVRIGAATGFTVVAAGMCLWLPLVAFNDLPPFEAGNVARRHATAIGYDVSGSGTAGDFITQPDAFGGCEVQVSFVLPPEASKSRELTMRLKRSSALASWRVTSASVHDAVP